MKKTLKISAMVIGMMAFALTGCKKDKLVEQNATSQEVLTETENIDIIAAQAEQDDTNLESQYDEAAESIYMDNEGVANNFAVESDDIDADENSSDSKVKARKKIRANSFIACLRKLDLTDRQVKGIKMTLKDYQECKSSAVQRARAIYKKILVTYQAKAKEQIRLYKAGKITKKELNERIMRIRFAFNKELRDAKLKEKLHTAFKTCYIKMLRGVKSKLNDKQWRAFVACQKK